MDNVTIKNEKGKIIIEIDGKAKGKASKTGKSMVLASTHGNVQVPGMEGTYLGLNMYQKK